MGFDVKITTPLDWAGVTDHSEYAGVVRQSNDPASPISKLPIAEQLKVRQPSDIQRIYLWLGTSMIEMKPIKELVDPAVAGTVWKANNDAANAWPRSGHDRYLCRTGAGAASGAGMRSATASLMRWQRATISTSTLPDQPKVKRPEIAMIGASISHPAGNRTVP